MKQSRELNGVGPPRYTTQTMPRYPSRYEVKTDKFEKLPRKLQILLLMLFMLVAAAIEFLMGLYSVRSGQPIVLGTTRIDAIESFFWCAACLVIVGGLFAVLMGWAKSSKTESSQ